MNTCRNLFVLYCLCLKKQLNYIQASQPVISYGVLLFFLFCFFKVGHKIQLSTYAIYDIWDVISETRLHHLKFVLEATWFQNIKYTRIKIISNVTFGAFRSVFRKRQHKYIVSLCGKKTLLH